MNELKSVIVDAQKGNHKAFSQIVKQFQDMAYATAFARMGDADAAEEAAQEAFLEAYLHLSKLKNQAAFPGWFRTILLRQCNRVARRKSILAVPLDEVSAVISPEPGPSAVAESKEQQQYVQREITSLPEHERDVVTLFYIADYSQKEIADLLNIRISTVKNRLFSARNRLRERMNTMIDETTKHRPSQDDSFVQKVTEFIAATEVGDTKKVTQMLKDTSDLANAKGEARYAHEELYPLHSAAVYGFVDIAKELLDNGADINAKSDVGWTPLLGALMTQQQEMVQLLIEGGAPIDIFAAAKMGDVERLKMFIEENPGSVQAQGPRGSTPLHFASTVSVAQYLVEHGADINTRDASGSERQRYGTPLRWNADNPAVAQYLLSQGAEVDDIFLACALGDLKSVKMFIKQNQDYIYEPKGPYQGQLVHLAADKGRTEILQMLLDRGVDINAKSAEGHVTPLHLAASSGHLDTVNLLLEHGADIEATDTKMHSTPLGWARFWKQDVTVQRLRDAENAH